MLKTWSVIFGGTDNLRCSMYSRRYSCPAEDSHRRCSRLNCDCLRACNTTVESYFNNSSKIVTFSPLTVIFGLIGSFIGNVYHPYGPPLQSFCQRELRE